MRTQPTPGADPAQVVLRVSGPGDLIFAAASLMGFMPHHCIVVLFVVGKRVKAAARYDLDCPPDPDLDARLHPMYARFPGCEVVLIGVGEERGDVDEKLGLSRMLIDPRRLRSVVGTDLHDWWCDDGRTGVLPATRPVAFDAALRAVGGRIEDSREAVVQRYAGPDPATATRLEPRFAKTRRRLRSQSLDDRRARVDELSARGRRGERLAEEDLVELACLVSDTHVRDWVLSGIARAQAVDHRDLWHRVVSVTPDHLAPQALAVTAVGSWLLGDGVAMISCLERALAIDPRHRLSGLLVEMYVSAMPTTEWDSMRGEMVADTR